MNGFLFVSQIKSQISVFYVAQTSLSALPTASKMKMHS